MDKILIDDTYASREARQYTDISPTLRSERFGFKVIEQRNKSSGDAQPLKRRRTEEERRRRHLYGDKGATFSKRERIIHRKRWHSKHGNNSFFKG